MTHHRNLAESSDRDRWVYAFDLRGLGVAKMVVGVLSGFYGLRVAWQKYMRALVAPGKNDSRRTPLFNFGLSAIWNMSLLGFFVLCGRWYLYFVVWLYPVMTTMVLITILHTLAEHQPDSYDGDPATLARYPVARTTLPNFVEKWLFFQSNFNYHFEHHVFPSVPCHALPAVHATLRQADFFQRYPELLQTSCLRTVLRLTGGSKVARDVAN